MGRDVLIGMPPQTAPRSALPGALDSFGLFKLVDPWPRITPKRLKPRTKPAGLRTLATRQGRSTPPGLIRDSLACGRARLLKLMHNLLPGASHQI